MDMKNKRKFLVMILALLIMCLCLTGCDELDDMRAKQAFWTTELDRTSITYNNTEYKALDLRGSYGNPLYNVNASEQVSITEKDVPVLLSNSYGMSGDISKDEVFIQTWLYDETTYSSNEALYCRADMYDSVSKTIADGIEYTNYGTGFFKWNEKEMQDEWIYYYLTEDEIDAINKVFDEVKPVENTNIQAKSSYVCAIDKVSKDKMFGNHSFELFSDIAGNYYIVKYTDFNEDYVHYEVPQELSPIFENIGNMVYQETLVPSASIY